tara:strand:+ start:561 stop:728 length:168 start_codon:yes stop_codon:yes gene_type:complete
MGKSRKERGGVVFYKDKLKWIPKDILKLIDRKSKIESELKEIERKLDDCTNSYQI